MDFIVREFIPETCVAHGEIRSMSIASRIHSVCVDEEQIYGQLLPEALKLCRVLASHGSSLAFNLIQRYGLDRRLRNHLVAVVK